jgi:glycosyltransferase involved in cell wall biosynthesis
MAGAETFLARLLRRARGSHVVHECVCSRSGANIEMRAAGIDFETLGIGGKANPLATWRLARAARRHQAALLHSHLSTASWWCGWLEQLGGPPSIGHVHGFTSAVWHRCQTHLIACSDAVRQDLITKGIAPERITVMHYPVDPDDMRPVRAPAAVRAELGVATDAPVVGTFAHLSLKKGYRELVRAAEIVLRRLPAAQFWCFGDGPLREELAATARSRGIAARFRLFGFRRDVPDLMRAIDVMCLPSRREPFGLVYVEAALAGKPVIACHAGGAPEIIIHGETGLLVPPQENVAGLAEAILTLLDNRGRAETMGARGRELAIARFGWPQYLARLSALYDQVVSGAANRVRQAA